MSIPVEVDQIAAEMDRYGASAFVVTVRDDGTPHIAHVTFGAADGVLTCPASRTAALNVAERPSMSVLWPPFEDSGYSMIVDGEASVDGEVMSIAPTNGVLHRPAARPEGTNGDCSSDCAPVRG